MKVEGAQRKPGDWVAEKKQPDSAVQLSGLGQVYLRVFPDSAKAPSGLPAIIQNNYFCTRLRPKAAKLARPVPKSNIVVGSGTEGLTGSSEKLPA